MNTKIFKIFIFVYLLAFLCFLPVSQILAAGYGIDETQTEAKLPDFDGGGVPAFLGRLAGAGLALAGSIFLFLIIYGGILIMTSSGSDALLKKGRTTITMAIIGALILGAAYAITTLVFSALT